MRQTAFNNWETTDDHGMHIYGIAKDQTGKEYYMVKNSWGIKNKYQGTWYVSKSFVKYKTLNILVHKKAIPTDIAKKINL
jgi:aminopeptidase C